MATATKKAPKGATSTAVAVKPAMNIVSIQEALKAQVAANASKTMPPTGTKIRCTQDKKFMLPDGTKTDGPIHAVILDFMTTHDFYEGAFDPKNIASPICFAVGPNPKNMVPSAASPVKQHDNCQACPMNQFGSNGTGKACKNGRSLALLPEAADAKGNPTGDVDHEADIWTLDVSPTALKGFDGYVQSLDRSFGQPPIAFLTEIGFDDSVTYARLVFSNPRPISSVGEVLARQKEATELVSVEPDASGYEAAKAAKPATAKTPARKPAKTPARKPVIARR